MKVHKWSDLKRSRISTQRLAAIEASIEDEVVEMNLAALRELAGVTQKEMAVATGAAQSEISRSERRTDHLVSTLRDYVEALGGDLEVVARFGDKSIRLRGV